MPKKQSKSSSEKLQERARRQRIKSMTEAYQAYLAGGEEGLRAHLRRKQEEMRFKPKLPPKERERLAELFRKTYTR